MLLLFCVAFDVAVVVLASARVLLRPAVDVGVVVVVVVVVFAMPLDSIRSN